MRMDNADSNGNIEIETPSPGGEQPVIGKILEERFAILEFIGQGGMSQVFRARHLTLNKDVAIKMLSDTQDSQSGQRFVQEAKVISKFDHPNVVKIHAFSIADGAPYLVMDFLQGRSLKEILSGKPLELERALNILSGVTRGLIHAHEKGVIHRDLKSSNILVVEESGTEVAKIVDFGIAKCHSESVQRLTKTGSIVGTPTYMSPEQFRGQPLDARSDLYSLGCVFYETLSGKVPFERESPFDLALAHLADEVPPLPADVPRWLNDVTMQLLSKEPEDRIQTAVDVQAILQKRAFGRAIPKFQKATVQNRGGLKLLLIAALLLGACFSFYVSTLPGKHNRTFDSLMDQAESRLSAAQSDSHAAEEGISLLRQAEGVMQDEPSPHMFSIEKPRVMRMLTAVKLLTGNSQVSDSSKLVWLVKIGKHLDWLNDRVFEQKVEPAEALLLAQSAVAIWEQAKSLGQPTSVFPGIQDSRELAQSYVRLGALLTDMQRYQDALKAFETAEKYDRTMRKGSVYHLRSSALCMSAYKLCGLDNKADQLARTIESDFLSGEDLLIEHNDLGQRNCLSGALLRMAVYYEIKGDNAHALATAEKLTDLSRGVKGREEALLYTEGLTVRGRIYIDNHNWRKASNSLNRAMKVAKIHHLGPCIAAINVQLERIKAGQAKGSPSP